MEASELLDSLRGALSRNGVDMLTPLPDRASADAIAIIEQAKAAWISEGEAKEQAAVIDWLRSPSIFGVDEGWHSESLAQAIEKGAHRGLDHAAGVKQSEQWPDLTASYMAGEARGRKAGIAEGMERAAVIARLYATKPIGSAPEWTDEQADWHEVGSIDTANAIAAAIRASQLDSIGGTGMLFWIGSMWLSCCN